VYPMPRARRTTIAAAEANHAQCKDGAEIERPGSGSCEEGLVFAVKIPQMIPAAIAKGPTLAKTWNDR